MDAFKNCFGRRLKQVRKSKGFTQERLSDAIEINLRQLARIEAGESFVTAETLQKICDVLDISPDTLFIFDVNVMNKNKGFNEIVQKLEVISDDENKLEFIDIAIDALSDKPSLEKLKFLIKGLELKN